MDGQGCEKLSECPQTTNQKDRLSDVLSSTEEVVNKIEGRLNSVLSNPAPPSPSTDAVESELVPFAHEIRMQRRRLENCNELLHDLFRRIEL